MDVLLPFAAAVLTLRLAAALARRWRGSRARSSSPGASRSPASPPRPARSPGARGRLDDRVFRAYYLFGGLLTAALLGAGSLLRAGVRVAGAVALVYAGLAIGVALAVPIDPAVSGSAIPTRRRHLDLFPARVLALVGNIGGTVAAVGWRSSASGAGRSATA